MLLPIGVVAADGPALTPQQQEVLKMSEAWRDAFNRRDLETFAHYVANDFIASTDEGELLTKTAFIQYLSARPPKDVQKTDAHDFQIHVDGDAAIVNYLVTSLNTWRDTTIVFHRRRTEFFKKTDGMWLALAAHQSPVPVNFRKSTKAPQKHLRTMSESTIGRGTPLGTSTSTPSRAAD
jgi:ketosteroid isomerase-like protein